MAVLGLTKARSMGPVADAVERAGGSPARVFRAADLPLRLIEQPERFILLRDQLRLLACAAREIGDPALAARLSMEAGVPGLGALGQSVLSADRLDAAIARTNGMMGRMLQSSTRLELIAEGEKAYWTYRVTDASDVGRQMNELLALGYMLDLLRRFLGPGFTPHRAAVSGAPVTGRAAVELALGAELSRHSIALLSFPAEHLCAPNPRRLPRMPAPDMPPAPIADDLVALARHLIALQLLERRPSLPALAGRLGLSQRTLQRRLGTRGITFETLLRDVMEEEAELLLRHGQLSVAAVALELGFADVAHFSRAFRGWKGMPPRAWRRLMLAQPKPPAP
ncbi:AraC family transcriptional regulator ligand-binding domain-containing protein [Xanthobacter autotrophicus DSM 431]|uniref:helix-turn-helix domain-containing protein n=1 Tax=Xanthobacter nonsaccharivorans TaxID=3119912 RepID=UPI003726599D